MTILFPDLSEYQPNVDFNALRVATPIAAVQACWGTEATITKTPGRAAAVRAAHFQAVIWYVGLRSDEPVLAQVEVWQSTIGALEPNEGIAIDWESAPQLAPVGSVLTAQSYLSSKYGIPIGVYAGPSEHATLPTAGWRWVAAYEQPEPMDPHLAWQFTNGTYVSPGTTNPTWPGGLGKCDTSVTHSNAAQFLVAVTGKQPGPPPGPPQEVDVNLPVITPAYCPANWVKTVQAILRDKFSQSVGVDGTFGAETVTALENVQKFFKLSVTGHVDAATWPVLLGL